MAYRYRLPPCYLERGIDTLFRRAGVHSLTVSLMDPDRFIATIGGDGRR